jgi:hypothetical protein
MDPISSATFSTQFPRISSFITQNKTYFIAISLLLGVSWVAKKILQSIRAKKEIPLNKSIPDAETQLLNSFGLKDGSLLTLKKLYQIDEHLVINIIRLFDAAKKALKNPQIEEEITLADGKTKIQIIDANTRQNTILGIEIINRKNEIDRLNELKKDILNMRNKAAGLPEIAC